MPISKRRLSVLNSLLGDLSGNTADRVWRRMRDEFLDAFVRLDRQALPAAELRRELAGFMHQLSQKVTEDLARQSSSIAYSGGRSGALRTAFDNGEVQFVTRSELLDENTCVVCEEFAAFPIIVQIDSPEYDEFSPPNKCEGGDRCRGVWVAITPAVT